MKKGFTLIELVMVTALVGIVAITTFNVLDLGLRAWRRGDTQSEARQEVRGILQQWSRELKIARSLVIVSPTHITFGIDEIPDGIDETIEYQLSGSNFQKIRNSTTYNLLSRVTSLSFTGGGINPLTIALTVTGPEGDVLNFETSTLVRDALP